MYNGLTAADAEIRSHPDLAHTLSLLVFHQGELLFERYYRRAEPEDLHAIHSVTKSVTSTVVGILAGDGLLSLDAPVSSMIDAPAFGADPAKSAMTVRHLLTMTSGLDPGGRWDIDDIAERGEPLIEGTLEAPLLAPPGERFAYNNGAAHVLSLVVEAAAGRPLAEVTSTRLFEPLGIERWEWAADPQGHHSGWGGLRLAPRDLVKVGRLYLDNGRWDGARVVDEGYVRAATSALTNGGPPEQCPYGYLWWVVPDHAPPTYFAGGWGGQYVVVSPALDLVAVTTADAYASPRPRGLLLRFLLMSTVLPALAEAAA